MKQTKHYNHKQLRNQKLQKETIKELESRTMKGARILKRKDPRIRISNNEGNKNLKTKLSGEYEYQMIEGTRISN